MYLFISDVHLRFVGDRAYRMLLRFLELEASKARALYILGDLFDFWYGDELLQKRTWKPLVDAFFALGEKGVQVFLIRGNHDPLIGRKFDDIHPNIHVLEGDSLLATLDGRRVFLTHGDIFCLNSPVQALFFRLLRAASALPLRFRRRIALWIYRSSRARKKAQTHETYLIKTIRIHQDVIAKELQGYSVDYIIHGHTHQPGLHTIQGGNVLQVILGAWSKRGAVYAKLEDGRIRLETFPSS